MSKSFHFQVYGRYALFTDPITKLGGEKSTYHLPTYSALKGILDTVYWKPTFEWVIESARVMNPIRTHSKGVTPVKRMNMGVRDTNIYTYLVDVHYQVSAHFRWVMSRETLAQDRNYKKHESIADRWIRRGGKASPFLGTSECGAVVEPVNFGEGQGHYDDSGEIDYGLMFHDFEYPETGEGGMYSRFFRPVMRNGVVKFPKPEECDPRYRQFINAMTQKSWTPNTNFSVEDLTNEST